MIRFLNRENNNLSNTISGLDQTLYEAFSGAAEKSNTEVAKQISYFAMEQLYLAFSQRSAEVVQQLIFLPTRFLLASLKYSQLSDDLIQQTVLDFRCLNMNFLDSNDKSIPGLESFEKQYFDGLLVFFHHLLDVKQTSSLQYALNELKQVSDLEYFPESIRWSLINRGNPKTDEEKISLKAEFTKHNQFHISHRRSTLILLSWSLYLYDNDVIDATRAKILVSDLNPFYRNFEDLLEDLDYIRDFNKHLRDNISWLIEEPLSGQTSTPPDRSDWILYGACFVFITNQLSFSIDVILIDKDYRFLEDSLRAHFSRIKAAPEKWALITGSEHIESDNVIRRFMDNIEAKEKAILVTFSKLRMIYNRANEEAIAQEPLDTQRIAKISEDLFETWKKANTTIDLFSHFGALSRSSSTSGLVEIGLRELLKGFRMNFVKEHHQHIYGFNDLGSFAGRELDGRFIRNICNEADIDKTENKDWTKELDLKIEELQDKGYIPDLIIFPPELLTNDEIYLNPNFIMQSGVDGLTFSTGKYRDILTTTLYARELSNQIIVASFLRAFQFELIEQDQLLGGMLEVSITDLSKELKDDEFSNRRSAWNISDNGSELSDEDIKLKITNSLLLKIITWGKFSIKDGHAFRAFYI